MYQKVLVANRGEIALRIIRTLREMGIGAVAVYSDADRQARHVLEADEAFRIGPASAAESYLNQRALIQTALRAGAAAIHPGYGFLAENAEFADAVASAELTFIGPRPSVIRLMGNKIAARQTAVGAGVSVVHGTPEAVDSLGEAQAFAAEHGFPVLVKAGGGGGGRGIRVVENDAGLQPALESASREASAYFGNPEVYLEKLYDHARHIEVQVAGDVDGVVVAWGERDCSTQRRRQKLVEETPAPGLTPRDRTSLMGAAQRLAEAAEYVGVGTVEFLYAGPGSFYFLEMNTRIQVEHTITEEVTGVDLVKESVQLSLGMPATAAVEPRGHAIEARINAEDPADSFRPGPGLIEVYREPGGQGVRVDSGAYQGCTIPGDYDSLVSKLVVHAPNRDEAISKMLRALREYDVQGIPSTISLIANIVDSADFRSGSVTTNWLDGHLHKLVGNPQPAAKAPSPQALPRDVEVEVNGKRFEVRVFDTSVSGNPRPTSRARSTAGHSVAAAGPNRVVSPMRGTVLAITKSVGDEVAEGERLVLVEAMKMENEVRSHRAARIKSVLVAVGDTVENQQTLIELEP